MVASVAYRGVSSCRHAGFPNGFILNRVCPDTTREPLRKYPPVHKSAAPCLHGVGRAETVSRVQVGILYYCYCFHTYSSGNRRRPALDAPYVSRQGNKI